MKINKETQRLARRLFLLCFVDSILDETRFRTLLAKIIEKKPRNYMALLKALQHLLSIEEARHKVSVTSAFPLPEEEQGEIARKITSVHGDKLEFEWKINPEVIAGLRIQIADKVYDGTVLNRLERLQSPA